MAMVTTATDIKFNTVWMFFVKNSGKKKHERLAKADVKTQD